MSHSFIMSIDVMHIARASQERRSRVFLEQISPAHASPCAPGPGDSHPHRVPRLAIASDTLTRFFRLLVRVLHV